MFAAARALVLLVPLSFVVGCSSSDSTGNDNSTAMVRFVNATGSNLDASINGQVGSGNGNLAFGTSSSCMTVNASNPALSFRQAGTATAMAGFTPSFQGNGNYTVIAYPGAGGATQFATLSNAGFTPASGQAGLRFFNADMGGGNFDVYVTAPGGAMTTANAANVAAGAGSTFFDVGTGSQQIRFTTAGSSTVAYDFGNQSFTAGKSSVVVLAPPANGSAVPRAFLVTGC